MELKLDSRIATLLIFLFFMNYHLNAQEIWTRQNSGTAATLYGVHFLNDHNGYVVGDSGVFLQTKDGGINWSKQSLGNFVLRAVQFVDSSNGYIAGYGSSTGVIFKTTDGGISWDSTTGSGLCLAMHFMNKDTGIVVGFGRLIIKTTDAGKSWINLAHGQIYYTSGFINDIYFVNDTVGFIAAGDCGPGFQCPEALDYLGQIGKTTDGGDNWEVLATLGTFYSVSFGSDSVGFAGGMGSRKTTDGGKKWNFQNISNGFGLFFVSPDIGWSVGRTGDKIHGIVSITTNGGNKWNNEISVNTGALYQVFFPSNNYGWTVGSNGTILRRTGITSVEKPTAIPSKFTLYQNYPNPFNPTTTISYTLPEAGAVQIKVYDVLGREITKLVDEIKSAGKHTVDWNGSNYSSGIYFYTITYNNQTVYKKMLMIK